MRPNVDEPVSRGVWRRRIMWLALIWAASVAALGVAAYAMRWVMKAIGMSA